MNTPVLSACHNCRGKVFEYEDNTFGCDDCKAVWVYREDGWWNVNKERTIKKSELKDRKSYERNKRRSTG